MTHDHHINYSWPVEGHTACVLDNEHKLGNEEYLNDMTKP